MPSISTAINLTLAPFQVDIKEVTKDTDKTSKIDVRIITNSLLYGERSYHCTDFSSTKKMLHSMADLLERYNSNVSCEFGMEKKHVRFKLSVEEIEFLDQCDNDFGKLFHRAIVDNEFVSVTMDFERFF